jgi:hypothetical protein
MHYVFGMDLNPFLPFEFLFALIYIESKRDPEKMVMVWFFTVKSNHSFLNIKMHSFLGL